MKKRILSLLLCVAMLLTLLPQTVLFASADDSGTCGENLEWSFDEATGTLTITGSGDMDEDWNYTLPPWFSFCDFIKNVILPSGLTSIGGGAFYNCGSIASITIPFGVTRIGSNAFFGCWSLTSVTVPGSVTSIGNDTFAFCSNLANIALPDSVISIGSQAFFNCGSLKSITIPGRVTTIGSCMFCYCDNLTSVTISDSVTTVEPSAFSDCNNLTDVYFVGTEDEWNGIEIGSGNDCLTNATIHFGQTEADPIETDSGTCGENLEWSFDEATGTLTITGSGAMNDWTWGSAPWFSYCSSIQSVSLPDGLTSIGADAFDGCTGLTAISIPDSVTSIGDRAFYDCTGLTAVSIPDSVTSIGDRAFYDCTGLTAVSIPDSVTSIGDHAFCHCTGLTAVSIPDSVTSIGEGAFADCTGLTAIAIPDSVTSIGGWAFYHCTGLTSITLPSGVTSIGVSAFYDCTGLTSITLPSGVTSIGGYAFCNCTGLTGITIGNGVTSIGEGAFAGCTGLTDVYYPGTEEEWNAIDIDDGNDPLTNATIHFGQTGADPCEGYTDINRGSWYHSAAEFVIERGYMGSTSTTALTFEPNTKVSRAMVASILYRICGSPAVEYSGKFTDVKEGSWYTKAIEWCAQNGLASGYTDGTFKPNATVSRQELAVFMYKLANHLGRDVTGRADLSGFADASSVPNWSKDYLAWAVDAGIISGQANGGKNYLKPADGAKRCEFASILMRFLQK